MREYLRTLKEKNPNFYALYQSIVLAIWFNGISSLLSLWFPERGYITAISFLLVALVIFWIENNSIGELVENPIFYPVYASIKQPIPMSAKTNFIPPKPIIVPKK